MMALTTTARAVLFGKKNNQLTFNSVAKASLWRALGSDQTGQPTVGDYAKHLLSSAIASAFGVRGERFAVERLPHGWPADVFAIAAKEIAEKSGTIKLPEGQVVPAFRLTAKGAQVLPTAWVAYIKGSADYSKVEALGDSIRESLSQAGKKLTVRVAPFPLRIEVDRPSPEKVTLDSVWPALKAAPKNKYEYMTGFYFQDGALKVGVCELYDPREWSGVIAGAAGSGKSQFSLAWLLSMALNTSPEYMSLVIGDPKCADLLSLSGLPHLAYGRVLSDIDEIRMAVKAVEAEMDRRIAARDKSIVRKRVVLFLDEWADIAQLDTTGEIAAAVVRLGLKGRFWGINIFLATQKTTSAVLSTLILANLVSRFCLRVGSFDEAKWVSGQSGCYAHKLPGNGAMLLYNPQHNDGLRVQGFYVGDPGDANFDNVVGAYVGDIIDQWTNVRPHWSVNLPPAPEMVQSGLPLVEVTADSDEEYVDPVGGKTNEERRGRGRPAQPLPYDFYKAAEDERARLGDKFKANSLRKLHKALYGKELNPDSAKELHDTLCNDA
jgi:hypothetical protein